MAIMFMMPKNWAAKNVAEIIKKKEIKRIAREKNLNWIDGNHPSYRNHWVVLSDGKPISKGKTRDEAVANTDRSKLGNDVIIIFLSAGIKGRR